MCVSGSGFSQHLLPNALAGAVETDFHLVEADLQSLRNLVVTQFFDVAEMHHEPLFFRELLHFLANLIHQIAVFGSLVQVVCAALVGRRAFEGCGAAQRLRAGFVERAVAGQRHAPCFPILYLSGLLYGRFPYFFKHFLYHVFRLVAASGDAQGKPEEFVAVWEDLFVKERPGHAGFVAVFERETAVCVAMLQPAGKILSTYALQMQKPRLRNGQPGLPQEYV